MSPQEPKSDLPRRGPFIAAVVALALAGLIVGGWLAAKHFRPHGGRRPSLSATDPAEQARMGAGPYLPPRHYVCTRAAAPLTIDGRLDKEAWKAAPWTEDFVDIEGDRR